MKPHPCQWGIFIPLLAVLLFGGWRPAWGIDPEASLNAAGVIDFPTALDQPVTNLFHGTVEVIDLGEPDLSLANIRYGLQLGNFQALADFHLQTTPSEKFDFGEIRAKLRILPLDEIGTDIAIGILGRFVENSGEKVRIDDREASLFGVVTVQMLPFDNAGPLVLNFYLDNIFLDFGLKIGLADFISIVAEADYLHSQTNLEDRDFLKAGIEIEGEQNFYFQLYFSDRNDNFLVQIGSGF